MALVNFIAYATRVTAAWLNKLDYTIQQRLYTYSVAGGTVNDVTLTTPSSGADFVLLAGARLSFNPTGANTGAVTIDVNGTGAVSLLNEQGNACTGGELSFHSDIVYTGAAWKLVNPVITADKARQAAEIAASVIPVNYQYPPGVADRFGTNTTPGTTDMTTALVNWAKCATKGLRMELMPGGTYMFDPSIVTNGILFSGVSGFDIHLNGATIIAKAGVAVVAQHEMMRFNNCQYIDVFNGIIDANRANRTPVESTSHNINVADSCKHIHFYGVRCINATTDGFYVGCDDGATLAKYPEDIYFDPACSAYNAYRNNMSVVASVRCKVRGTYTGATGTSPQAGVDFEPDSSHVFGNKDLDVDVQVEDNVGYGVAFAGPGSGADNVNVKAIIKGRSNTAGLLQVANVTGANIDVQCGPHSAATRGVVDISNGTVSDLEMGLTFRGVTINSAARWLLYNFGTTGRLKIKRFSAYGCPNLPCVSDSGNSDFENIDIENTTDVSVQLGANSTFKSFTFKTSAGRVLYTAAANVKVSDGVIIDCLVASSSAVTFAAGATNSIMRNVDVIQTSSIPASAKAFVYGAIPGVLQNCSAKSAGTDFTVANAFDFTAGTAGAFIDGCTPGGQTIENGIVSPAQITASQNDYNPTSLQDASILRLFTDASRNLTGLVGGADGRRISIFNIGGFDLVLTDNDAASTAANRFLLGANITLNSNEGIKLWYDGASSRWRSDGRCN